MRSLPLAEFPALRRSLRRTLLVRVVLGGALVALLALAVLAARGAGSGQAAVLPQGRSGVVVLDLSASISGPTYGRISTTLQGIVDANQPIGLVMFSTAAYELLPPGSPPSALAQLLRFFVPRQTSRGAVFPTSPWSLSFRAGTSIGAGLREAVQDLQRAGVRNGSVVLVSDLNDPPEDRPTASAVISYMRRHGIPLRIVPLYANARDLAFFRSLAGRRAFVDPKVFTHTPGRAAQEVSAALPRRLILLGVVLVLLLAANERFCARLALPSEERA